MDISRFISCLHMPLNIGHFSVYAYFLYLFCDKWLYVLRFVRHCIWLFNAYFGLKLTLRWFHFLCKISVSSDRGFLENMQDMLNSDSREQGLATYDPRPTSGLSVSSIWHLLLIGNVYVVNDNCNCCFVLVLDNECSLEFP